jgi:hypothetical protein
MWNVGVSILNYVEVNKRKHQSYRYAINTNKTEITAINNTIVQNLTKIQNKCTIPYIIA